MGVLVKMKLLFCTRTFYKYSDPFLFRSRTSTRITSVFLNYRCWHYISHKKITPSPGGVLVRDWKKLKNTVFKQDKWEF